MIKYICLKCLHLKNGCIFIYNTNYKPSNLCGFYAGIDSENKIVISDGISGFSGIGRFADNQEKINFLARLEKECHKHWNPETKQLEDIRWRAEYNNIYYRATTSGVFEVEECTEMYSAINHLDYICGNYFRTPEAAKKVAYQIKDIFKNSKSE